MIELYLLIAVVVVLFTTFTVIFVLERRALMKMWANDKQLWNEERQKLLDRIQAPSFEVYKHAEIVKAKVEKQTPEPDNEIEEV